jgi:hypothetical protein
MFTSFLEHGLGFPSSEFIRRFLTFYNIQPMIWIRIPTPKGWDFPLWLQLFYNKSHPSVVGNDIQDAGG